ncbi:MAG: hypothetical protein JO252_02060 [Planctomycetaceae bacterium]|nr:hypothetical protein [Planctomycetaceae bacterium]
MSIVFLLVAFAGVLLATFRSLGWGFLAVLAVGYFNGVVRANFLGVYTTFMFDAAVLGLYLGFFGGSRRAAGVWWGPAGPFVLFLIGWPALLCCIPVNHILIQLVALRATVWYLPVLLIATRLTAADLVVVTRGLVVLNLVALAGGLYVYLYGVEVLYPRNAVTQIIYKSKDVAMSNYHRVPSTFLSAHAYGGTMLSTLRFLLDRVAGVGVRLADRGLAAAGVVAAAGGLLMCAARSPLVLFAVALAVAWVLSRFSLTVGLVGAVLVGGGVKVAGTDERFQRASSLGDTESVANRLAMSANASFLDLLADYPVGAGMGSSVGTSIPYFLADVAPEQIGLENEFSRILVDQGWVGLGGWLAFVGWLCVRPPPARTPAPWRLGVVFMYSLTLASWVTAFIGAGMLSSVPGSVLLLTQMGVLVAVRAWGAVPGTDSPRPAAPAGVRP